MKRENMRIPMGKGMLTFCTLLMLTIVIGACHGLIPETQQHDYVEIPNIDYQITDAPEFVDDVSLCRDPEKRYVLPDGCLYESKPLPVYSVTNQLMVATDTDGAVFNTCGYQDNTRIRGNLELGELDYSFVTGFIPIQKDDVLYFNKDCFSPGYQYAHIMHIVFYNSDKQIVTSVAMSLATESAFEAIETNEDGYISAIRLREEVASKNISYVRLTLIGSGKDQIISVNEPLVPSCYSYMWIPVEEYIPSDWYQELEKTVDAVNNIELTEESSVIKFLFATDIHLDPNSTNSYTRNLGKVCAEVMRACDIPFFVTGGDNCTQSPEYMPVDFQVNMEQLLSQFAPIPLKNILLAVGNHDGATGMAYDYNGEKVYYRFQLNNQQRSSVFFDWQKETNENKKFDSDGTYFYLDNPTTKTRYIVLNSFWAQWAGNEEGYVPNIQNSFFHNPMFGPQQLHWFATEALDMPPEYGAIIVAHFTSAAKDFSVFQGIVDAFSARTVYKGKYRGVEEWQSTNISVDFENANGEIIAVFQGHNHQDSQLDEFQNIPCVQTTTAGAHWAVRDENAEERVKDTSSEFAVDVVVIDRANRKIYITRLGAGDDRVIEY